jgi:DNA-binding CsgD family transcriptional regulator
MGAAMPQLSDHTGRAGQNGTRALSERDLEALRHLAAGRSTAQIAVAMSISTNTVRTRIRRVQDKLAAPDRDQVVDAARILGVL